MSSFAKRYAAPLLATAGLAATVRLLYGGELRDTPALLTPVLDGAAHVEWARGWLRGSWPGSEPYFRAPGYVWALALALGASGDDPARAAILQLFAGILSPLLTALLAARLFGAPGAWLAGSGAALYPTFLFLDAQLLDTSLGVALFLVATLLSLTALDSGRSSHFVICGLVWGVASIVRPPLLLGALVPLSFFLARGARSRALFFLGAVLLLPLATTARNVAASGDAVFIASQGGLNFYLGNGKQANGMAAAFPDAPTDLGYRMIQAAHRLAEEREGRTLRPSEVSAHYVKRTFEDIAEDPLRWLLLLLKKGALFWLDREIPNNHDFELFAKEAPLLGALPGWGVWVSLGLVGGFVIRARQEARFLAALIGSVWISCVLFFVNDRFRLPAAPLLIVLGAGAALELARSARERRAKTAAIAVGCFALFALLHLNPYRVPREPWVLSYVLMAEAERNRGEPVRALRWIDKALKEVPGLYAARVGQVELLRACGRVQEARELAQHLLKEVPGDPVVRNENAVLLDLSGNPKAALREIEALLAIEPSFAAARVNRAVILARLGREAEARQALTQFLRENPPTGEAKRARAVLSALSQSDR
jgi:tetratricopeptide (TPR) repeat protein